MVGKWSQLARQPADESPSFSVGTMLLLTDGRVMVQEDDGTLDRAAKWHALSPDRYGSYRAGTWTSLNPMRIAKRFFASGVLKDGRVFVIGGEHSAEGDDVASGEVYDPQADRWCNIAPPPKWLEIGDSPSCVLPDGRVLIAAKRTATSDNGTECGIYDPVTDSWCVTGGPVCSVGPKNLSSSEETWILLPNRTVLTVTRSARHQAAEKYVIDSNTWILDARPSESLMDRNGEIGPAMLLYDGCAVFFGSAKGRNGCGHVAVYKPPSRSSEQGTWLADIPSLPKATPELIPVQPGEASDLVAALERRRNPCPLVCVDCPATLLPNGKVLFVAGPPRPDEYGNFVLLLEFDPRLDPPRIDGAPAPCTHEIAVDDARLLLLPDGNVLYASCTGIVECYEPDGGPKAAWRPTILDVRPAEGANENSFVLKGRRLNGFSQANIYGDDVSNATNYPLVRLKKAAREATQPKEEVWYARTYDFSSMGVATGPAIHSTKFDLGNLPTGDYLLVVVANGIESMPYQFAYPWRG